MFTRDDYIDYFEQISSHERAMAFKQYQIIERIQDEEIIATLKSILKDEVRHNHIVGMLFDRYIKPAIENRRSERDRTLGSITFHEVDADRELTGFCLDISMGGSCIQTKTAVSEGLQVELTIFLIDRQTEIKRRGIIQWCRQTGSETYQCGIEFTPEIKT